MQIYLPIAEVSVNIIWILGLGGMVGYLSGMFGVGGGFLMTPLLIFSGIPSPVAVGTEANQIVAASVSGVLAHLKRGNVDIKMGLVLVAGGFLGSSFGVWLFTILRGIGQIDLVIRLSYVVFLAVIGWLMLFESAGAIFRRRRQQARRKLHHHLWVHGLPFKMRFRRSKLYISALLPLLIGFFVGVLAAIMGVGGGFIMVPAMIYLLGMPTAVVVGTSLFQIIFVTANVTLLQAYQNQTVDVMLALLLMTSAVIGAQLGVKAGTRLRGEETRGLLGLLVLAVGGKLAYDLVSHPGELYTLGFTAGGHRWGGRGRRGGVGRARWRRRWR
ncbi:MAG: sulfite exporter TauE/SafE family protein [Proteobacteria bacterium]|nr:sulfite exporter TauE/SafE family protein [Pseudomonadota bacterium]